MKKFISLVLIISIVLCCLNSICTWGEINCSELNDKNQIANLSCAMDFGKEQIIEGKKSYIKMDNVGKNSEYTLYFFDPKEINQLLKKFSAPMSLETFDFQDQLVKREQEENTNKVIEKISSFKDSISSTFQTLGLAWAGYVAVNNFDVIRNIPGQLRDQDFDQARMNVNLLLPKLIVTGVLTLLGGATNLLGNFISSIVGSKSKHYIQEDYGNRFKLYAAEDDNYFSALEKIITNIKLNLFNINKFLCLRLNNDPDRHEAEVFLFNNEKAQYTESEKIKFNEDIETLKNDIEEILTKK